MRFVVLLVFGLILMTSGCVKVGPDFTTPPAPVSDSWLEPDNQQLTVQSDPHEEWWTVFNDPVLNGFIADAYQQNLSLEIAGLRVLESRAQLGIATGNLYPQQQQLFAGAAAVGGSSNSANTTAADLHYKDLSTSMDAAWELDFWGNSDAASNRLMPSLWRPSPIMMMSWSR